MSLLAIYSPVAASKDLQNEVLSKNEDRSIFYSCQVRPTYVSLRLAKLLCYITMPRLRGAKYASDRMRRLVRLVICVRNLQTERTNHVERRTQRIF